MKCKKICSCNASAKWAFKSKSDGCKRCLVCCQFFDEDELSKGRKNAALKALLNNDYPFLGELSPLFKMLSDGAKPGQKTVKFKIKTGPVTGSFLGDNDDEM